MSGAKQLSVAYVTSSEFKIEECRVLCDTAPMSDGRLLGEVIRFHFRETRITETLEVDIEKMVRAEVASAYNAIRVPCIVEHAGLVFEEYTGDSYPGGLTKPMWDTLGERFVEETNSANRRAIARAVVGYCDGLTTRAFTGETAGRIAASPRGARTFYWDTVFIPDGQVAGTGELTYAEIVEAEGLGLPSKMTRSQSGKALMAFAEFAIKNPPRLWRPT